MVDAPTVMLSVLGPLQITGPDGTTLPRAARQRHILTVLAVAAIESRAVSADQLLEAVYGDEAPQRARRSLSTELWRCRQLLAADAIVGESDGYRLDPHVVEVDAVRFIRALDDGRGLLDSHDFAAAGKLLSDALDLWRGAPLIDWRDHPDGQAALAHLDELRIGATEDLAEALAGQGRHSEAIEALQTVIRVHPAREHACALLIECHLAMEDRRRARTALDSIRRTLADHGVDLGAELRAVRDRLQVNTSPTGSEPRVAIVAEKPDALIGRQSSLSTATRVLQHALQAREPAAVIVVGEAGIGKSALLARAIGGLGSQKEASSTGAGAIIGRVQCDRRLALPYAALAPLLKLLESHASGPADVLAAGSDGAGAWTDADALQTHIVSLVESAATSSGGLVLVVEDAHWATPELVEVLLALLARRSQIPLALAVSIRDPAAMDAPLQDVLAELRGRAAEVIRLTGLDETQTRELLGADLDRATIRAAHRLTRGNPLFLRQLTFRPDGGFVDSPSLAEALDEHIDSLPVDILTVIEVAAAIGTRFDPRLLISAVGHPPMSVDPSSVHEALQAAGAAGLIHEVEDDGTELEFVHALIRDELYGRAPIRTRTRAHALIGRALSRLTTADATSTDLLAHHCQKGWPMCPTIEVVERLYTAGESAIRHLGFSEADEYLRSALDFIEMDPDFADDAWLARLLASSGQAAAAAGKLESSRASYLALHAHGERTGRPDLALAGALGIVRTHATQRIDEGAVDRLAAALERLLATAPTSSVGERDLVAESLSALQIYWPVLARDARERATRRDPTSRTQLVSTLWEHETVENSLVLAQELVERSDADPLGSTLRLWASEVAAGRKSFADEPPGIWSLEAGTTTRWERKLWQITTTMAAGQFDRALRLIEAAEPYVGQAPTATETAGRVAQLLGQRISIALQQDDWTEMARLATANRPMFTARRPIMRTLGAQMQVMLGDHATATRYCDELTEEFIAGIVPSGDLHPAVFGLTNACLWVGHGRGIELGRQLLAPWAGQHVLFYLVQYWGSVNFQLGRFASFAGDLDEAVNHLRVAVDEHSTVGAKAMEARTQWLLAANMWHRNRGTDRADAEKRHAVAVVQAESFGLVELATRAWPPASAFHPS